MRNIAPLLLAAACVVLPPPEDESTPHHTTTPTTSTTTPHTTPTPTTPTTTVPCAPQGAHRRLEGELLLPDAAWSTIQGKRVDFVRTRFAWSVLGVDDVTGDGLGDVFTMTFDEAFGQDLGGVHVLPSPLPPGPADHDEAAVRLVDDDPGQGYDFWFANQSGSMVAMPDLTGDGLPEIALGSSRLRGLLWDDFGLGGVFVLASPISAPPGTEASLVPGYATITATSPVDGLGHSLDVGDVDGDGVDDLVASSPKSIDSDGGFRGEVYVFTGPLAPGPATQDAAAFRVYGDSTGVIDGGPAAMGDRVIATDLDGDGIADVVVTSQASWVDGESGTGEVYTFSGPLTADVPTSTAVSTLQGDPDVPGGEDHFGSPANPLGDTDGDGYPEIAYGSVGNRYDTSGNVWVVSGIVPGVSAGADVATTHFHGVSEGDDAYYANAAGDLDEDGFDDVLLASISVEEVSPGAAFVVYGPLPSGSIAMRDAADATLWADLGAPTILSALPDTDGDCMPDVAVSVGIELYILRGGTF